MIVYILIYIVLFLAGIQYVSDTPKIILICIGVFLVFFAGLRGEDIGGDYLTYKQYYLDIKQAPAGDFIGFVEPTFILFSKVFSRLQFLMIFYALLGVAFKLVAFKKLTPFVLLTIAVWFSHFFLVLDLNEIRASVAMGLLLISVPYILKRDLVTYSVLVIFAIFFHYSAIVFFPLYFLNYKKVGFFYYVIIPVSYVLNFLGVGFIEILARLPIPFLQAKIESYNTLYSMGSYTKINIYNPIIFFRIFVIYILLANWKTIQSNNEYGVILIKSYVLSIAALVLFSSLPVFGLRISDVFSVVEIILLPFLLYLYKPRYVILIILFFFGLFIISIDLFYNKFINPYTF